MMTNEEADQIVGEAVAIGKRELASWLQMVNAEVLIEEHLLDTIIAAGVSGAFAALDRRKLLPD